MCSVQEKICAAFKIESVRYKSSHKLVGFETFLPHTKHQMSTMPKTAKQFASQLARSTPLLHNPETVHLCEITQSCIGFAAEEYRIKTKYRTCLAQAKKTFKSSSQYITGLVSDREHMEAQHVKKLEDDKLQELETAAREWLAIVRGNEVMQPESDVEGGGSDGKEDENQMLEDEEWNGIGNDDENDNGSEDWKTDDEEADDSFEEGIVDVSDSEILYDKNEYHWRRRYRRRVEGDHDVSHE